MGSANATSAPVDAIVNRATERVVRPTSSPKSAHRPVRAKRVRSGNAVVNTGTANSDTGSMNRTNASW